MGLKLIKIRSNFLNIIIGSWSVPNYCCKILIRNYGHFLIGTGLTIASCGYNQDLIKVSCKILIAIFR